VFGISNAEFTCGVEHIYLRIAGTLAAFHSLVFANGVYSIRPGETINYPCDASKLISMTSTDVPATIDKICIWVTADYRILGLWPQYFISAMFQWPAAVGQNQWLDGAVFHEGPPVTYCGSDYGTPRKIVDCSRDPPDVYTRFKNNHLEHIKGDQIIETK
jgi:hypothetical protein